MRTNTALKVADVLWLAGELLVANGRTHKPLGKKRPKKGGGYEPAINLLAAIGKAVNAYGYSHRVKTHALEILTESIREKTGLDFDIQQYDDWEIDTRNVVRLLAKASKTAKEQAAGVLQAA